MTKNKQIVLFMVRVGWDGCNLEMEQANLPIGIERAPFTANQSQCRFCLAHWGRFDLVR